MRTWTTVLAVVLLSACGPEGGDASQPGDPTFGANNGGNSGGSGGTGFGFEADGGDGQVGTMTGQDDPNKPDGETVNQWDDLDPFCGYGTVYGLICSKNEQTFVDNAHVWVEAEDCNGNLITRETYSDDKGYYTLEAVPNGLQTINIKRDDFEKSYTVQVNDGKVSDVTGVAHKECFQAVNPCPTGSIVGTVCSELEGAIENATVSIQGPDCDGNTVQHQTVSNADGSYFFPTLDVGTWTVVASANGQTLEWQVEVEEGKQTDLGELDIELCFEAPCFDGLDNIPVEAKSVSGLADIVMFIDTSGSMKGETTIVKNNLNGFTNFIGNSGVDFRVILVAEGPNGNFNLCVPPPLGDGNCGNTNSFMHIADKVGSHNGLEKLQANFGSYKSFLRKGATTNFIAVTDDNSDLGASSFKNWVNQQPEFSNPWYFHSIVAMGDIPIVGCFGGAFGGVEYISLSDTTGGFKYPICNPDWASMWPELATQIVDSVVATCIYDIPDKEKAKSADSVDVSWIFGANSQTIPAVSGPEQCGAQGGWYFDDPANPTQLVVCEQTCSGLSGGVFQVAYGCGDGK